MTTFSVRARRRCINNRQFVAATVFKSIKVVTGERHIWMRATPSALVSQLIDTVVVSYMFLYFSMGVSFPRVTAIALVS